MHNTQTHEVQSVGVHLDGGPPQGNTGGMNGVIIHPSGSDIHSHGQFEVSEIKCMPLEVLYKRSWMSMCAVNSAMTRNQNSLHYRWLYHIQCWSAWQGWGLHVPQLILGVISEPVGRSMVCGLPAAPIQATQAIFMPSGCDTWNTVPALA